jgi:hypothetical protein
MISPRIWLLATALFPAAFVAPAQAAARFHQPSPASASPATAVADKAADIDAAAPPVAAKPAHEGLAFAARPDAQARLVEPDGRVIATDGASDLVSPASIAQRRMQAAIARMITTAARNAPIHDKANRPDRS